MEMYMLMCGTKAEVYDIVLESLYYEVTQSSNKKINKSSLKKGFKHTKHQKKGKAVVDYHYHLTELDPEKGYNMKVETNSGTITMGMRFETDENGLCEVCYYEDFKAKVEEHGILFKISDFFYQRKITRRGRRMLKEINQVIKNKHKEAEKAASSEEKE